MKTTAVVVVSADISISPACNFSKLMKNRFIMSIHWDEFIFIGIWFTRVNYYRQGLKN